VRVSDDASDNPASPEESGFFSLVRSGSGAGPFLLGSFPEFDDEFQLLLQPDDQTFTMFMDDPFELAWILGEIQDNNRFAIRVDRCCGDFVLREVGVVLDANLVPEPSTVGLILSGTALIILAHVRKRRWRMDKPCMVRAVKWSGPFQRV
jgi:hypothetical protein